MANTGATAPELGLATRLVSGRLEDVAAQLRRATVFFMEIDKKRGAVKGAGSGVVADFHGTKVVLTAGHVLRNIERAFEDDTISLSVHQQRGHLPVSPASHRLVSPGDEHGVDAGVLILPPEQVETYFQYSGVDPIRATTVRIAPPEPGMDCIIAGYQKARSPITTVVQNNWKEIRITPDLSVLVVCFRESDAQHDWVEGGSSIVNFATGEEIEFRPGDLDGMSGCGFWSVERNGYDVRFALHGVHTGTGNDRLRETPIRHHLRLLAEHSPQFRQTFADRWQLE